MSGNFLSHQKAGYAPAVELRMTVADRIFTRIGANDNILAGQSTFMLEVFQIVITICTLSSFHLVLYILPAAFCISW